MDLGIKSSDAPAVTAPKKQCAMMVQDSRVVQPLQVETVEVLQLRSKIITKSRLHMKILGRWGSLYCCLIKIW